MDFLPDHVILSILKYIIKVPEYVVHCSDTQRKMYEKNIENALNLQKVCRRWEYLIHYIGESFWSKVVVHVNRKVMLNWKDFYYRCLKEAPLLGELRLTQLDEVDSGDLAYELLKHGPKKIRKLTILWETDIITEDFSMMLFVLSGQLEHILMPDSLHFHGHFPKLQTLHLYESDAFNDGWPNLEGRPYLPELKELTIGFGVDIYCPFFQHVLGSSGAYLKSLRFDAGHYGLLPPILRNLHFPQLERLSFDASIVWQCYCSKCFTKGSCQWNGSKFTLLDGVEAFKTVSDLDIEFSFRSWNLVFTFVKYAPLQLKKVKFTETDDCSNDDWWRGEGQTLIAEVLSRNPDLEIFTIEACSKFLGAQWERVIKRFPSVKWSITDNC